MPESTVRWAERLINSLGVPVVILCVLAVATYKTAGWLSPYVERVMESHIDFVEGSSDALGKLDQRFDRASQEHLLITEILEGLVDTLEETE